ncbi:acyl-CoA dehydrogenase [Kocuria flava]|uniref:Acyl-CoA dehydrogenase n=1 Tax=Kocuria flava TaxID=446860 RepID=A0A0U3HEL3_9MICC|nr:MULTISPECIES: acyl-CoA dehydrogenase family protein [Kocuria]ALU39256.1 acyl-CoA dehydrogenase [Kocuria flava]MCD1146360.1 acyl-CoA dehydrogenase family protein [Kocuria sp. LUK]PLC11122.1 acyl-CoA dehydrogenase [Kocuria flava]GEO93587.1 acyl-CoA dehydrogenase [Kocuria flava]
MTATPETGESLFPAGTVEPDYVLDRALDTDAAGVLDSVAAADREHWMRARAFVEEDLLPVIGEHWDRAEYSLDLVRRLGELDLLRDGVAVEGFAPMSKTAAGLVCMELSRGDGSIATVTGVQGGLAMRSIAMCGTEEQRQRWLPRMATGELLGAFALTEPTHGSDSVGLETRASPVEGGWLLNGEKKWIGNGSMGGITVVWARSDADGRVHGFVVPQESEGYTGTTIPGKLALRAIHQAHIRFENVFVPEENVLPAARSFKDTAAVLFATRIGVAWGAVGHAQACYESAVQYAAQRVQFGRPLAASQIVQERLARMLSELTQIQLLVARMTEREEAGTLTAEQASLAKYTATRAARSIAANARDLLGGNGILVRHRVARHFADVEALHTYEGTETVQALIVGRGITGISAFA